MKILVTGATGFIGKNLIESLIKNEYELTIIVNNTVPKYNSKLIETYKLNFNDIDIDIEYFKKKKFNIIIHLATFFVRNHSTIQLNSILDSNIKLGLHLLECSSKCKIDLFLNFGTFWQHFENKQYSPVNLYAASKQAFERLSKYYVELCDLKFVTLKINDSYGPNDTRKKILNLFETSLMDNTTIKMSAGNQLLNMLYIDDIVSAIMLTIVNHKIFKPGSEYILKSKKSITVRELADLYMSLTKTKLNIDWGAINYNQREFFQPFKKGKLLPGWKEKYDIISGLIKYLDEKKASL